MARTIETQTPLSNLTKKIKSFIAKTKTVTCFCNEYLTSNVQINLTQVETQVMKVSDITTQVVIVTKTFMVSYINQIT